jgi:hypothetical protein
MLRHQHSNSLTVSSQQQELLDLHYRLKKQREEAMIAREEQKAHRKFQSMLACYQSL